MLGLAGALLIISTCAFARAYGVFCLKALCNMRAAQPCGLHDRAMLGDSCSTVRFELIVHAANN